MGLATTTAKVIEEKAKLELAHQQGQAMDYKKTLRDAQEAVKEAREANAKFKRMVDDM